MQVFRVIFQTTYSKNISAEHFKLGVVLEVMDIVACHRLGKTNRVLFKRLNQKDGQHILEEEYK